jgi:hypothetical protein
LAPALAGDDEAQFAAMMPPVQVDQFAIAQEPAGLGQADRPVQRPALVHLGHLGGDRGRDLVGILDGGPIPVGHHLRIAHERIDEGGVLKGQRRQAEAFGLEDHAREWT